MMLERAAERGRDGGETEIASKGILDIIAKKGILNISSRWAHLLGLQTWNIRRNVDEMMWRTKKFKRELLVTTINSPPLVYHLDPTTRTGLSEVFFRSCQKTKLEVCLQNCWRYIYKV